MLVDTSDFLTALKMCPEGFQAVRDVVGCTVACRELREEGCSYRGDMANCLISTDNRSAQRLVCARSPPPRHLKVICPFLSTLVNEGILKGDVFTRAELLNVTVAAGMEHAVASAHVSSNFKNEPSGVMNIFKMDGATNEHKTSVGIHDCISVFSNCTMTAAGIQTCHNSTESCKLPLRNKFEDFWVRVDVNGDGKLTREELATSAPRLPFNDANPIGEGTIEGSHGFIITVFGDTEDEIGKAALERVFLDRRFPHGYKYPRGARFKPRVECGVAGQVRCRTCKQLKENSATWGGAGSYTIKPKDEEFQVFCTERGWTKFMQGNALNDVYYDDAAGSYGSSASGEGKLADKSITDLIAASGGSVWLQCGSYAFVVKWTQLSFQNWVDWKGQWSTRHGEQSRGSRPSSSYHGFLIQDKYRVTGGSTSGLITMVNPAVFGHAGAPCRVQGRGHYSLTYYVVD